MYPKATSTLCDPGEARTHDPVIKSHLLYQLSYRVIIIIKRLVGFNLSSAKVQLFLKCASFFLKNIFYLVQSI